MVWEVIFVVVLLPVLLFIMLMALVVISDNLHYSIDFCSKKKCGPVEYFFLQLLSTVIQVLALPVYLVLLAIDLVLNFIVSVMQTLSMGVVQVLGIPMGLLALSMALAGCVYYKTCEFTMSEEAGG